MKYHWTVQTATLAVPQPTDEPPQLDDVLMGLELSGWEVFTIISDPVSGAHSCNRVRVVARKRASPRP